MIQKPDIVFAVLIIINLSWKFDQTCGQSLERVQDENLKSADRQVEEDLERIRKTLERLAKVSFADQVKTENGEEFFFFSSETFCYHSKKQI